MTDVELVLRKLAVLREHLGRARRRRPATAEALASDVETQDSLSLSVIVAIQEAIDVAFHVVTDEGWGVPSSSAEGFDILSRHSVIDAELAATLSSAVRLRNRVAHAYATLDVARLWAELPEGLDALARFVACVAAFLPASG